MKPISEVSNDALLQEVRHRVATQKITIRVESLMAGRGVLIACLSTHAEDGSFTFGVEDTRPWVRQTLEAVR